MTRLFLSTAALALLISASPLSQAIAQAANSCGDGNCNVGGEGQGGYGTHFEYEDETTEYYSTGGSGQGGFGFNTTYEDDSGFSFTCRGGGTHEDPRGQHCDFE